MKYRLLLRVDTLTQSTLVNPDGFGGWLVQNTGRGKVKVLGVTLAEGEKLDYTTLQPSVQWETPISIEITDSIVVLHRLMYQQIKE